MSMQKSKEFQNKVIDFIFEIVSQGNIDFLKQEIEKMGFKKYDELSTLIDEEQQQNALFNSCIIKDPVQAFNMSKFLIEEGKCNANHKDALS